MTDERSIADAVEATTAALGPVDILVNNAGINVFHKPLETTDAEWARCMAVDLDGAWRMSRADPAPRCASAAAARSSTSPRHTPSRSFPAVFPYPVAKHGLLGLTRALGIEFAAENIRVNAIAPGYIETQIAVDYWNTFPDPDAERRRTYDLHPPKRIGRPEEVAMTAVFLASDEAPFINAACLVIDGGRSVLYHE